MVQQHSRKKMGWFVLELDQSRPGYRREKYCCTAYQRKQLLPPPQGTTALTHVRNDSHPPTQPPTLLPTNAYNYLIPQPPCSTGVQQQGQQQTEAVGPYSIFNLDTHTLKFGTLDLQRSKTTCWPPILIRPQTHHPPTNRYRPLLLHAEDTRTCK